MNLNCSRCGSTLKYPGALLFSPPVNDDVRKMHLCRACFDEMAGWITGEGGLTCNEEYSRLIGPTAHWVPMAHCSLPFGHEGSHGAVLVDGTIQYPEPEPEPVTHPADASPPSRHWWRRIV